MTNQALIPSLRRQAADAASFRSVQADQSHGAAVGADGIAVNDADAHRFVVVDWGGYAWQQEIEKHENRGETNHDALRDADSTKSVPRHEPLEPKPSELGVIPAHTMSYEPPRWVGRDLLLNVG